MIVTTEMVFASAAKESGSFHQLRRLLPCCPWQYFPKPTRLCAPRWYTSLRKFA